MLDSVPPSDFSQFQQRLTQFKESSDSISFIEAQTSP